MLSSSRTQTTPEVNNKRRLSALAQLISIHMASGYSSIAELMQLTGYCRRSIQNARAELKGAAECTPLGAQRSAPHSAAECTLGVQRSAPGAAECTLSAADQRSDGVSSSPLPPKKVSPHTPLQRITPLSTPSSPNPEQVESQSQANSQAGFEKTSPADQQNVFVGMKLRVSQEQHQRWQTMFPGFGLRQAYPLADAYVVEKKAQNGSVVVLAQKKLGYLAQDAAKENQSFKVSRW